MKHILLIGDGMADAPLAALDGRTPLEASRKPFLDGLCRRGELGLARTVPEGLPPGSDTAILALFGCDPRVYFSGRAPLELAASGGVMPAGGAAYRCNMVTLDGEGLPFAARVMRSHSAGSIDGAASDALVTWLFAQPDFARLAAAARLTVLPGHSFRHLAVQEDAELDGIVLAPPHDHLDEPIGPLLPRGCANAEVLRGLMARAFALLDGHPINAARRAAGQLPANGVWFWAEGKGAPLPDFAARFGASGGVVSAVPLCHGIARLLGLEAVSVPGATGEWDTDYEAKTAAALDILAREDFAALHLEGPDEATHDHDLPHKLYSIEQLSERVLRPLCGALRGRGEDFRLLVVSDHRTYMDTGAHGGEPVPYLLYDSRETRPGCGLPFTERDAGAGPFLPDGARLMPRLFAL